MKQGRRIIVTDGQIVEGKNSISHLLTREDGEWMIEKSPYKKDRSLRQNNWYWKVLTIIGEHLGYYKDELHEVFLDEFAPIKTHRDLDGRPVQKPVRTSQMNVEQMSHYMERIIQFAAENGIVIPDPEEFK